jgi:hypothetical protein
MLRIFAAALVATTLGRRHGFRRRHRYGRIGQHRGRAGCGDHQR